MRTVKFILKITASLVPTFLALILLLTNHGYTYRDDGSRSIAHQHEGFTGTGWTIFYVLILFSVWLTYKIIISKKIKEKVCQVKKKFFRFIRLKTGLKWST